MSLGIHHLILTCLSLSDGLMGQTASAHLLIPMTLEQAYASETFASALGRLLRILLIRQFKEL